MFRKTLGILLLLIIFPFSLMAYQLSPLNATYDPSGAGSAKVYTIVNDSDSPIAIEVRAEQRIVDIVDHNYTFQVNNIYTFFKYTLTNISQKYKNPLLTDYKDIYKNKPAIIVSAGPSLHKNIDVLKKYQKMKNVN